MSYWNLVVLFLVLFGALLAVGYIAWRMANALAPKPGKPSFATAPDPPTEPAEARRNWPPVLASAAVGVICAVLYLGISPNSAILQRLLIMAGFIALTCAVAFYGLGNRPGPTASNEEITQSNSSPNRRSPLRRTRELLGIAIFIGAYLLFGWGGAALMAPGQKGGQVVFSESDSHTLWHKKSEWIWLRPGDTIAVDFRGSRQSQGRLRARFELFGVRVIRKTWLVQSGDSAHVTYTVALPGPYRFDLSPYLYNWAGTMRIDWKRQ